MEAENGQKGRKRHVSSRRRYTLSKKWAVNSVDNPFFRKVVLSTGADAAKPGITIF